MRLFATWEVEKSSPNCIPRLCSLTLTRLVILKPLENELQSVILAVKMQSSKRTLRSNEIIMPPKGLLDTELELSFSLQYPHFLKRDGNKLLVMLQRRKKYKNRTILGYKTLAIGQVNMAQVLQRSVDRELCLYSDLKERTNCLAQVMMLALSSQPVDHLENGRQKLQGTEVDRSPDVEMSDYDEAPDDQDFSSNEELMSDSEAMPGEDDRSARLSKFLRGPMRPRFSRQQRNLKQKFVALLRRFRVSDEVLDSEQDQEIIGDQVANQQDIEDLFDELENLSESDPEMDTLSVLSTPKPKLRPFFTGRGSTEILDMPKDSGRLSDDSSKKHDSDSHLEALTDGELSDSQGVASSSGQEDVLWATQSGTESPAADVTRSHSTASSSGRRHRGRYQRPPEGEAAAAAEEEECERQATEGEEDGTQHQAPSCCGTAHAPTVAPPPPHPQAQSHQGQTEGHQPPAESQSQSQTNEAPTPHHVRGSEGGPLGGRAGSQRGPRERQHAAKVNGRERTSSACQEPGDSCTHEPRKVLLEQLSSVLHCEEDTLPDSLLLINTNEWQGQILSQVLQDPQHRAVCTCSPADVKATVSYLVSRIQKFCNSNSRSPGPIKVGVAGGDGYVNSVLRPYVEQFSSKSPDWLHYVQFLIIPLGGSSIGKYLSTIDGKFASFFNDSVWRDALDKPESTGRQDMKEIVKRIVHYMSAASYQVNLPISEAMLTYKDKSSEDESSQVFVPFINDVRIGPIDLISGTSSVDLDDSLPSGVLTSALSSSPPLGGGQMEKARDNHTPPNSPCVGGATPVSTPSGHGSTVTSPATCSPPEVVDLQLDYWVLPTKSDSSDRSERLQKKDSKSSLKTTFRSVQVYRLPQNLLTCDPQNSNMSMVVVTKEKKQKIMRIGKKSKDSEAKSQTVEGISRLICTSKTQNQPLKVCIDGVEWMGVKFFQLSSQWQTHVKYFPVFIFGHTDTPL